MQAKILPYNLKVRDYLKSKSSVWEFYSVNSHDDWEITRRIIDAILEKKEKGSGFWQMARIYRLYSAIARDRAAGEVYVTEDPVEHQLRLRALQLWQEQGEAAGGLIARLIEGTQELGNLDVFGRERMRDLTRELVRAFLRPARMRSAPVVSLALAYFPDLTWPEEMPARDDRRPLQSMAAEHGSIRDYFAFVLIDLALADPLLEEQAVPRAVTFASQLGIARSFAHLYNENYGKPNRRPL